MIDVNSLSKIGNLTKPATVLIEKISSAIGILYEPLRKVREAKANAKVSKIATIANIEITEIKQKAFNRLIAKEVRNQGNIEEIVSKAIGILDNNAKPADIDDDWINHFFDNCKNIGNTEMQDLWAFILAGEANNPGTFSKRTLNHLKLVSKEEAILFSKFCQFVIRTQDGRFIHILGKKTNEYLKQNAAISVAKVTELEAAGFVLSTIRMKTKLFQGDLIYLRDKPYKICLGVVKQPKKNDRIIEEIDDLQKSKNKKSIIVEFIGLSLTGGEIYPFSCTKVDEGYFKLIVDELREIGCELKEIKNNAKG
jgi:hypothetical protein